METYLDQNYTKLRKHHQELGVPWTDPKFPANDSSIGLTKARELRGVEWVRAGDIRTDPKLVKNGVGRHDVVQGRLGNCWFVAAASVLAGVESLWKRVVPDHLDQEWDIANKDKYSGIFRFRFWRFGRWLEVLVDDFIPTREGVPVFTYSKDPSEWWGALLEKAYAKLHGSYEALDGGNLSDALVDFTGGVSELIQLQGDTGESQYQDEEARLELFHRVAREVDEHALICCAIRSTPETIETRTATGLVRGHAYGVTCVKRVPIGSTGLTTIFRGREKIPLVRLRNPWAEKEWNGPFSDKSPEWKSITEREREKLGLVTEDDGEFWMPWDDFVEQFSDLSINHLINTSLFSFTKTWKEIVKVGKWSKPFAAGGCLNHTETFLRNPQYRFDIECKEDEEEEIIIQLSQKDEGSTVLERQKLVIGTHVVRVEQNRKFRLHRKPPGKTIGTSDFIRSRHVFYRASVKAGRYVVLPTTFKPGEEGDFLLRVFAERISGLTEMVLDEPQDPACFSCGCAKKPQVVTRVTVVSGEGFPKKSVGKTDPYVVIKCEGEKVQGAPVSNTLAPTWDLSAIFYRKQPGKEVKVQVWDYNRLVMDTFYGQCLVKEKSLGGGDDNPFGDEDTSVEKTLELYNRGKKKDEKMQGSIKIKIETYRDLSTL